MGLDVLSPYFNSLNGVPDLPPNTGTVLRVAALCVSSCARALCGMAAGGSKAAITLHFTRGLGGTADVGDLNAKDGSKETVLALVGVLVRLPSSASWPHVHQHRSADRFWSHRYPPGRPRTLCSHCF
jgi:hypothetical protein